MPVMRLACPTGKFVFCVVGSKISGIARIDQPNGFAAMEAPISRGK